MDRIVAREPRAHRALSTFRADVLLSVQVARAEQRAGLLVMRRSGVRYPKVPKAAPGQHAGATAQAVMGAGLVHGDLLGLGRRLVPCQRVPAYRAAAIRRLLMPGRRVPRIPGIGLRG